MKIKYRILIIIATALFCLIVSAASIDIYITSFATPFIFSQMKFLPDNKCGLLLGTSKYRTAGGINPFFSERLNAAALLYRAGKIQYIIASGDNSELNYNEPRAMMAGLKDRGIPADRIFLDYAGFRTLDSVVRAREIFGQDSVTVVSQKFHNERAVYIGKNYGIDVWGFNADDGNDDYTEIPVRLREIFARVKAFIDVKIFRDRPRFLGEKIYIP